MKAIIPYLIVLIFGIAIGAWIFSRKDVTPPGSTLAETDRIADSIIRVKADSIKRLQADVKDQRAIIQSEHRKTQRANREADTIRARYGRLIAKIQTMSTDTLLKVFDQYTEADRQAQTGIHARDPTDTVRVQTQRIESAVRIFVRMDSISAENHTLQSDTLAKRTEIKAYQRIDLNQLAIIGNLQTTNTAKDGKIAERDKALKKERRKTKLFGIIVIILTIANVIR